MNELILNSPVLMEEIDKGRTPGKVTDLIKQGHRYDEMFGLHYWLRNRSMSDYLSKGYADRRFAVNLEAVEANYIPEDPIIKAQMIAGWASAPAAEEQKMLGVLRKWIHEGVVDIPRETVFDMAPTGQGDPYYASLLVAVALGDLNLVKKLTQSIPVARLSSLNLSADLARSVMQSAILRHRNHVFSFLYGFTVQHGIEWPDNKDNSQALLVRKALTSLNPGVLVRLHQEDQKNSPSHYEKYRWESVFLEYAEARMLWKKDAIPVLTTLLELGGDVNYKDHEGTTPLMMCCKRYKDHPEEERVLNFLIEHGADIHAVNKKEMSAFQWAALEGHTSVVNRLLDLGVDIDQTGTNPSLLLKLAKKGDMNMFEYLIKKGAVLREEELDKFLKTPAASWAQSQLDRQELKASTVRSDIRLKNNRL